MCLASGLLLNILWIILVQMSSAGPCDDFLEFQESIKKMRALDDNIIYMLNSSLPTESFKGQVNCEKVCYNLYTQLQDIHKRREKKIRDCILASAESLKKVRELRENNLDDVDINKKFKLEQRKVNIIKFVGLSPAQPTVMANSKTNL
ncbi:PREDICTED: coiled-coil domain-containing protein 58-like [Rhagoletis zephyria]|uniref:coiled-coil domain-containing protein 58-like n=1 Tax=Rhagoletis zephyria TaxID=28612 RepID=UPI0008119E6F|nr:PREDICTED: coiled-coil domain-containing protein 58-like [Rhagoletis zephyria]